MATVRLIGLLAELAQTREVHVRLKEPMKLRKLLPEELLEDRMIVLINQEEATLNGRLAKGGYDL